MKLIQDLGMQYPTKNSKQRSRFGVYECTGCLKNFRANTYDVKRKRQKYCNSCIKKTHGETKTKLYTVWSAMRNRCSNINNTDYPSYGGRGISVCDNWGKYENFREWSRDNGYSDGLSIDRINNDGNYEPSNCRWATKEVQARNTRILQSNNTSGYRGVRYRKSRGKWIASINVNKNRIYLGSYDDKIDAAKAYDGYIIENNLEHTINGV